MTEATNNPRKVAIVIRCFQQGVLGHTFSRPLTGAEGDRLLEIIQINGHGSCIFKNPETGVAVGCWVCTCSDECEPLLVMFCADLKISMTAQAQGEKSYTLTSDDSMEIQVREIGVHDMARLQQTAAVAQQVSGQIAAEVAQAVATNVSQKVAHETVVETLGNVAEYSASDAAQPKIIWHQEKPN